MSKDLSGTFEISAYGFSEAGKKTVLLIANIARLEIAYQCLEDYKKKNEKLSRTQSEAINPLAARLAALKLCRLQKRTPLGSENTFFTQAALEKAVTDLYARRHSNIVGIDGKTQYKISSQLNEKMDAFEALYPFIQPAELVYGCDNDIAEYLYA